MTMKIEARADNCVSLYFFGPIMDGYDEDRTFDETKVAKALSGISPSASLDIQLNSPGGEVNSALAINGILAKHKGKITIHVTGLAASAATLITSLPNAKTVISKGSLMMIHNPMSAAYGNAKELTKEVEILDKCAASMRTVYIDKTGLPENRIKQIMDEETWFTAEEAVEQGFADELDESVQVNACMKPNRILAIAGCEWDLKNLPQPSEEILMAKKIEPASAEPKVSATVGETKERMTAQILQAREPELFTAIVGETQKAERERIKALYEIDTGANHDMVVKAMFEEPRTAEQVAVDTLRAQKDKRSQMAQALQEDGQALAQDLNGLNGASGALPPDPKAEAQKSIVDLVHANLKKINGYK